MVWRKQPRAGLGVDPEIAVLERSVQDLQSLPESGPNVPFQMHLPRGSPDGRAVVPIRVAIPPGRCSCSRVTEHAPVADIRPISSGLQALRNLRVQGRLASPSTDAEEGSGAPLRGLP